ncbi:MULTISPECIES: chemotaxis protein CheW [Pseudoalteromonas]|uniref:Chemotaxis protein CheW n=1 Tax=Pseudoalteromonas obscura TaxID=3048491 RepID=A0ABT7EJA9_9GAMM|nr:MULTISPECIES: chemotaxis protein CheW [Pseudoalteromonas]MBQ4836713.1 purine-binding chemotaxis protein CheW [Pseudoalteromonas luteoviolacea]MDK2595141.1 chemotaxis protein CheW [Pseudoalteromonas sp. P94(2023)]
MTDHTNQSSLVDKDKYLAFELNHASYSINISLVKEIMEYIEVDPIPMAPEFIIGAINLRGEVIPVFDLSLRLGKQSQDITNRTCIIIAECLFNSQQITIGLKVDMVTKVLDISGADIDAVPSIGGQFHSRFVLGLAKLPDKLMTILDISKILTLDELKLIEDLNNADLNETSQEPGDNIETQENLDEEAPNEVNHE